VVRAAGSKGAFDLVALPTRECSDHNPRVIQVKRGKAGVPKAERVAMELLGDGMPSVRIEMWHRQDRGAWIVSLWDRFMRRWVAIGAQA